MRWVAWCLWAMSFIGGAAALLLETPTIPWFVATVICLALVRIEALHNKLDKFIVVEDDDD